MQSEHKLSIIIPWTSETNPSSMDPWNKVLVMICMRTTILPSGILAFNWRLKTFSSLLGTLVTRTRLHNWLELMTFVVLAILTVNINFGKVYLLDSNADANKNNKWLLTRKSVNISTVKQIFLWDLVNYFSKLLQRVGTAKTIKMWTENSLRRQENCRLTS